MANLVNGSGYTVSAEEDAEFLRGLIGDGRLVLNVGKQMAAEIVDNNTVRVYDGVMVSRGRRVQIPANTYDEFTILNGTQGKTRYDLLGYKLIKTEDGKEVCEQFVAPSIGETFVFEEGLLSEGDSEAWISLYRAKLVGLTLTELIPLYDKVLTPVMNLQKQITGGTKAPSGGEDGDVYIRLT